MLKSKASGPLSRSPGQSVESQPTARNSMAGPGGGPPRKSHTKSRKGCRMCKKRHIRCDESFPQCRNCTKHSVRCDYMDVSKAGDEPAKGSNPPNLLTSPELQPILDNWRLNGQPPLVELQTGDPSYWTRFSTIDLRLIHHITLLSSDLYRRGYSQCTPWTSKMSNLISVALSNDFAMSALLAFSATHLSWQTKNSDTEHLAYHHRGIAMKGLHEALGSFSEQISEAVLATSILLAWQATEWQAWASLQQGVSTVMTAMRQWAHQSELAKFLDSQRLLARTRAPTTPSLTGLPPQQPASEDLQMLDQIVAALHNLRLRISSYPDLVEYVDEALEYVEQLQQDYPLHGPVQCFERLLQFRSMIFWVPTVILRPEELDLGALAVMAHLYSLALVLEPLFAECGGVYLGNISLDPLEKVCQTIQARSAAAPQDTSIQTALSMLDVPIQIAHHYRASHRVITGPTIPYPYVPRSAAPQDNYNAQPYNLSSISDVSRHAQYSGSSLQSPIMLQNAYPIGSFQNNTPIRHNSLPIRTQADPRLNIGSPLHSLPPQQNHPETPSSGTDYFTGTPNYSVMPSYGSMHDYSNRLPHFARPIVPSNSPYDTFPPPNQNAGPHSNMQGYRG